MHFKHIIRNFELKYICNYIIAAVIGLTQANKRSTSAWLKMQAEQTPIQAYYTFVCMYVCAYVYSCLILFFLLGCHYNSFLCVCAQFSCEHIY